MARILVIDDDASLLDALSLAFESAGHTVLLAKDGVEGHEVIRRERPETVVSDVNMPGLDGFSLCRRLREEGNHVPFILLTSRDNDIDETLGLELGADDYIAKPFSVRVLLARVVSLLRRDALRAGAKSESPLVVEDLELFRDRLEVRYRSQPIRVTVTEFRLVEALIRRPGTVHSREQLLETVRGDSFVVDRIIDTYVRRLRRKFEAIDATFDKIETVVGAGYRWRDRGS